MSWRERYKNNEARFDSHIKAFQYKKKLSRQAIPMGSEAMFIDRMEDLDDFGTDEEEENQRPRGKKAARVGSDTENEDTQPAKAQSRPVSKTAIAPEHPNSKRKRVSDTSDRTSKRTRVIPGSSKGEMERDNPTSDPTGGKEDDDIGQDSQGEETLEVEQNLFYPSDEDSLAMPRWAIHFLHFLGIFTFLQTTQQFLWEQHTKAVHRTASIQRPSGVHFPEPAYSSAS